ncbi:phosphoglucomutase [Borreliella bissettiae]|uniref:Phosphoglucomutase/phosphomannomutase, alpha/beta/alpha domain I family protein n=2 Tax=Borrelia bissettiae TaxID=64897 RepID=G0AKG8_BORBD|nr:phosphoglucomutase [Borreliella bissettiae]AEL18194.1 phosphoglucomutase/phosphomannomutase, alpha/beta/alpha domain I family protein [Borreliella bissettiae DN127]WKC99457.1 phosphoglucomutase [Borreliella bissettiae]
MLKQYSLNMKNFKKAFDKMILSPSGFRKIFAKSKNEDSTENEINNEDKVLIALIIFTISNYFKNEPRPYIGLGLDSRPTGKIIAEITIKILITNKEKIKFFGILPITEILAYMKNNKDSKGFIYISASHNPTGYNGIKIGLNDGGVLNSAKANEIIKQIKNNSQNEKLINHLINTLNKFDEDNSHLENYNKIIKLERKNKNQSYKRYKSLIHEIAYENDINNKNIEILEKRILKNPIGIIAEMNGSSRINSIDKELLESLGLKVKLYNDEIGIFKHNIIPEGKSLNECKKLLQNKYIQDNSFELGYVPDCDGDRGNLVFIDKATNTANIIEAQKIFALVVISELSYLHYIGIKNNVAIVTNDATSLNIEKIANFFNAKVYRVEVGEANLTEMADDLRAQGLVVKISGEGSNGGCIIHPSRVRDPITTLLSIVKLLKMKELYQIWCKLSKNYYKEKYDLKDILNTTNFYSNVIVSSKKANLTNLKIENQEILKSNYENLLIKEIKRNKLFQELSVVDYEIINYEGKRQSKIRTGDSSGGLKVLLKTDKEIVATLWMRMSKTEPVTRVLSEVIYAKRHILFKLLEFNKRLIKKANLPNN